MGNDGFVSVESYPQFDEKLSAPEAEFGEDYLKANVDDIKEIIKVVGIEPKKIILYTTPAWKKHIHELVLSKFDGKEPPKANELMKSIMADEEMRKHGKEVASYTNKIIADLRMTGKADRKKYQTDFTEFDFLNTCLEFLKSEFKAEFEVYHADSEGINDPQKKARAAIPFRPAIYVE